MPCVFATPLGDALTVCGKLSAAGVPFRHALHSRICEKCTAAGYAALSIEAPPWRALLRQVFETRLLAGKLPRYQKANPVDMAVAFRSYRALAGDGAARALLRDMFHYQAAIPESRGGLPAADLAAMLKAIAREHGFEDVLGAIVREHEVLGALHG